MQEVLAYIHTHRSTLGIEHRLITFDERNRVTDLDGMLGWADQFATDAQPASVPLATPPHREGGEGRPPLAHDGR
jgi:hypothetical protein